MSLSASFDGALVVAWLAARSVARGLPAPVADHGGWRVDSGLPTEKARYVFTEPGEGLRALGQAIDEPWVALKLCRPNEELFALLPERWRLTSDADTRVMVRDGRPDRGFVLPDGYRCESQTHGSVTHARILYGEELAAGGYAAEHGGVFIYDRIVTQEVHQRRGLGRVMMAALGEARVSTGSQEILTATPAGRSLYLQLGWRDYSPYSTAMIPASDAHDMVREG